MGHLPPPPQPFFPESCNIICYFFKPYKHLLEYSSGSKMITDRLTIKLCFHRIVLHGLEFHNFAEFKGHKIGILQSM